MRDLLNALVNQVADVKWVDGTTDTVTVISVLDNGFIASFAGHNAGGGFIPYTGISYIRSKAFQATAGKAA